MSPLKTRWKPMSSQKADALGLQEISLEYLVSFDKGRGDGRTIPADVVVCWSPDEWKLVHSDPESHAVTPEGRAAWFQIEIPHFTGERKIEVRFRRVGPDARRSGIRGYAVDPAGDLRSHHSRPEDP